MPRTRACSFVFLRTRLSLSLSLLCDAVNALAGKRALEVVVCVVVCVCVCTSVMVDAVARGRRSLHSVARPRWRLWTRDVIPQRCRTPFLSYIRCEAKSWCSSSTSPSLSMCACVCLHRSASQRHCSWARSLWVSLLPSHSPASSAFLLVGGAVPHKLRTDDVPRDKVKHPPPRRSRAVPAPRCARNEKEVPQWCLWSTCAGALRKRTHRTSA